MNLASVLELVRELLVITGLVSNKQEADGLSTPQVVALTQSYWVKNNLGQTAADIKKNAGVTEHEAAVLAAFTKAGFLDGYDPQGSDYDVALILGAKLGEMLRRTAWLVNFIVGEMLSCSQIVWLVSERPTDADEASAASTTCNDQSVRSAMEIPGFGEDGLMLPLEFPRAKSEAVGGRCLARHTSELLLRHGIEMSVCVDATKGRANTEQTLKHWRDVAKPQTNTRVLVVSRGIYAHRQLVLASGNLDCNVAVTSQAAGIRGQKAVALLAELGRLLYVLVGQDAKVS